MSNISERFEPLDDDTQLVDDRLRDLYAYWRARRGERPMADRSDIDPVDIPRHLPFISLIERLPGTWENFRYRLVGSELVAMIGQDMTGRTLLELTHDNIRRVIGETFRRCLQSGRPHHHHMVAPGTQGCHYERILLPLTSGTREPEMILLSVATRNWPRLRPAFLLELQLFRRVTAGAL